MFLLVFWAYGPAMQHPPREDQWPFLLNTIQEDHFIPLVLETYSYNRSRKLGPGDYPLFRPVLFVLLSAEKALFGPRYLCWHLTGIVIHCAIVGVLLSLLLRLARIRPAGSPSGARFREVLAYLLTLFFAVNFAGTEMVIWCHIQGYMIYVLCVLGALRLVVDDLCGVAESDQIRNPKSEIRNPKYPGFRISDFGFRIRGTWRIAAAFVLLLVAAFSYEVGSMVAVCFGVALGLSAAWRGQVRQGLLRFVLFASLLPLFVVTDRLDRLAHPDTRPDMTEASLLERAQWTPTVQNAGRYLLFTLWQPFFPTSVEWEFEDRVVIPEPGQNPQAYRRPDPYLVVSYGVVLAGAGLALLGLRRILRDQQARHGFLFLLVPISLIALHLAIIVLGRMNMRPSPKALAMNSYYAYPPLLALLVGLYFLWLRARVRDAKSELNHEGHEGTQSGRVFVFLRVLRGSVLAGLGVLALCSAGKIHGMTRHICAFYRPLRVEMATLQKLIDEHQHEPNFAISFDPDTYYSLLCYHGLPRVHILFARYVDHANPTHIICGSFKKTDGPSETRRGNFVMKREEDYRRDHGRRYQSLPRFIEPAANGFMVFGFRNRYYGLHFDEGVFRTGREDYRYRLEGNSVAEVLRQIPAAVQRIEEETKCCASHRE
jgi:hypothetical protein